MINATEFINGYIEAAFWTTNMDHLDPEGTGHAGALEDHFDSDDIDADAMAKIEGECLVFMVENLADLEAYEDACLNGTRVFDESKGSPSSYAGHDFWLTRNGHGAGFWDRGLEDLGDRLTEASKLAGETWVYVGDDNKVYA